MIRFLLALLALLLCTIALVLWVLAWRGDIAPQFFAILQLFYLGALAALSLSWLLFYRRRPQL